MLSVDLEVRTDLPTTAASDVSQASVRSWLAAGVLVPCLHVRYAFGCPVLAVGQLQATAVNIASPSTAQDLWLAAGGRVGLELPVSGPWLLRAYGEVLGTVHRDTLVIGEALAHSFPLASGALGLALVVRVP
jgi:hypothetical protein